MAEVTEEKTLMTVREFFDKFPIFHQSAFAERVGLSRSMITAYKREDRNPTDYTLKKLNSEIQKIADEMKNIKIF